MANQFGITPASPLAGFKMLAEGIGSRAEFEREKAVEAKKTATREQASSLIQNRDFSGLADLTIANPWLTEEVKASSGLTDDLVTKQYSDIAADVKAGLLSSSQGLTQIAEIKANQGQDITQDLQLIARAQQEPDFGMQIADTFLAGIDPARYKSMSGVGEKEEAPLATPTDIDDFVADAALAWQDLHGEKMPPAERNKARLQFKRAQAKEAREVASGKTIGQLEAEMVLKPEVAAAVALAEGNAKAQLAAAAGQKSNDLAWNVYDVAMRNLSDSLAGTKTGPGISYIPALTANAQIANGAIAAMAPVLKQMFRASGEGVFTDKDQEMLLNMVPTRSDLPEARIAKISAIDAIVRAKLGMTGGETQKPSPATEQPTATSITEMSDEELMQAAFGAQ